MAGRSLETQVVVVGAGPVGLMLAGELRLGGAEVVVLERLEAPTTESRASTLHARTLEMLGSRGLLERFGFSGPGAAAGDPRGHFGGLPLDLALPSAYPGQWKMPQTRTEELLQEWALSLGAELRRGHTLRAVSDGGDHVEALAEGPDGEVRLRARYLVACDGEESTTRRLLGAGFPGQDAERELLRADVSGIEIRDRRFERLPNGLAIAARRPDGVTRVMVHEFGSRPRAAGAAPRFEDVVAAWRNVTGEEIGSGTPLWVNSFGDGSRQLSRYRHGRVLFAGDAAHRQMPVGGQALNLGLQDAFNLGWKLALQVAGKAPADLLDTYHEERHAVGARVLSNIRAQALMLLGGPEVEALRAVLGELIGYDEVRRELAGAITGLDVRYPIGTGHPLLGARLPHVGLTTADGGLTAQELLRDGRGLLLDLTPDAPADPPPAAVAAPWADRVTTVRAALGPEYEDGPLAGAGAVLVRPDGYTAWVAASGHDLTEALRRWFGPPSLGHTRTAASSAGKRRKPMGDLTGRTALVTGSSRGMGRASAVRLARDGALVAVHCNRGVEAAEEVVASIEKDGGRAFAVQAELGVPGDVDHLFEQLHERLLERTGRTELHILVNNAGMMGGVAPEETTPEQFDRLFAVNARAPFFLIQRALRDMPSGGRIINISSGLTRCANPEEIAYAMTKGAVEQLALHFAKYLGPRGITINSVAPGITRNGNPVFDIPEAVEQMAQLSAFGRVGEPEDIADVVAFLASEEARWITGSFVDATGGTLLG
jgi:bifunctional oxygenase/reductase